MNDIHKAINEAVLNTHRKILSGAKVRIEKDFQEFVFGELYKLLPNKRVKWEVKVNGNHQSYYFTDRNRSSHSRIDLAIESEDEAIAIELKYIKNAGREQELDLVGDIAKLEQVIEHCDYKAGYAIQLIAPNVSSRMNLELAKAGEYRELLGTKLQYSFFLKQPYSFDYIGDDDKFQIVIHEVVKGT
ncbi:hypothetical protein [Vibrio rotiferianus]|uniref:hypothetical protein n=1 Tax=Vibrio rotiferianus TaxID=190895 RepID=UPI0015F56E23|nr:hypothetical protein [Vibrio rotiferianus]